MIYVRGGVEGVGPEKAEAKTDPSRARAGLRPTQPNQSRQCNRHRTRNPQKLKPEALDQCPSSVVGLWHRSVWGRSLQPWIGSLNPISPACYIATCPKNQ